MRLPEPASRALRALKRTQIPVYAGNAAYPNARTFSFGVDISF